jgi:hypothetical protein
MHVRPINPAESGVQSHALFVDEQGRPHGLSSVSDSKPMDTAAYHAFLHQMMDGVRNSGRTAILIRIHGGRTAINEALDASVWQLDSMMADTKSHYYPLFVNWESTDLSSYGEHVEYVRQGQRYDTFFQGPFLAPMYFVADLGFGLAHFPIAAGYELSQYFFPPTAAHVREKEQAIRQLQLALPRNAMGARVGQVSIDTGSYYRGKAEVVEDVGKTLLLLPFKTVATYVIQAAGPEDFANMRRRTSTMFRNPTEFRAEASDAGYAPPSGAMSAFLDSLESLVKSGPAAGKNYTITLIGHSMGAIPAGEIVRTHPHLPFDNIVFMASASTMREFELGILPYLESHRSTQFYNLTLHRLAEIREQEVADLVPRGSLLSWLDGYLTEPETDMDRVIGRYDNIILATHMFPDSVRGQVHIKEFGYHDPKFNYGPDFKPYKHGQFLDREIPFWRCEFWVAPGKPCKNP